MVWGSRLAAPHERPHPTTATTTAGERHGCGIEQETLQIRGQVKSCRSWEARLVRLYALGEIDDDYILHETRRVKARRAELESRLRDLEDQARRLRELQTAEGAAEELGRMDNEDKRLLLEALGVRIMVPPTESTSTAPSHRTSPLNKHGDVYRSMRTHVVGQPECHACDDSLETESRPMSECVTFHMDVSVGELGKSEVVVGWITIFSSI